MEVLDSALYIVATPIGNLNDLSLRAQQVLRSVTLIAAEDTRHSARLLSHYNIETRCIPYHEHNEEKTVERVLSVLRAGNSVALISDAGTPLLSDPGYVLQQAVIQQGFDLVPVPGASAITAALSAAGLPTDRFFFEGFLPAKSAARRNRLLALQDFRHTLVFFEAPHRLDACLADMSEVFGTERPAVLARELSKMYESFVRGSLASIAAEVKARRLQRGELVLLVGGNQAPLDDAGPDHHTLKVLLAELPLKQAVSLTARITGGKKNRIYELALSLNDATE